jgi:hypothetical protein
VKSAAVKVGNAAAKVKLSEPISGKELPIRRN